VSNDSITLKVEERTVEGKAVKQLRAAGLIPAVIHDHGKESRIVMAPHNEIQKVYQQAGKHHPLSITLGKDSYMALIKDVDFDPKKNMLRHVVFNAVKQDEKVETEVPVHLVGEIPAEKTGLMVIRSLDHVDIEALPKDLIDSLEVDATSLVAIGDKVFVSDIKPPAGVTILTEPEHPIAAVEETKAQMSEDAAEASTATGAEGQTEASEEE
jgi:large subunit ribosomal protein L25